MLTTALRFLPWGADEAMLSSLGISLSDARIHGLEVMQLNERGENLLHIRAPGETSLDETLRDLMKTVSGGQDALFINKLSKALGARLSQLGDLMTTTRKPAQLGDLIYVFNTYIELDTLFRRLQCKSLVRQCRSQLHGSCALRHGPSRGHRPRSRGHV